MSNQSIGRGPAHGSNENHHGDPTRTTLGEDASQDDPPAGSGLAPDDAGMPGSAAKPGIGQGPRSSPDDRKVEDSHPSAPEAARGKLPRDNR